MSNGVRVERSDSTIVIKFVRPELRNPLSLSVLDEMDHALDLAKISGAERIIFTGTGNIFASGADLREINAVEPERVRGFAARGQRLMERIEQCPLTTTALINGACYGGALDLALSCEQRIAVAEATFCHPGTGLGIITGWGGTQRLPRLVGQANALRMFFTASPISASEALRIGLIDAITEDLASCILKS
ncbi:enoyl-CoA hydratase/isomerase family protein [Leptolyngbya sp. 7M]|uniref:enoyl-CoA hydratase/isomerase family protein n=1 Tax=Leptolyngbya sp. 7M TaxID=2812896 RepID=UPI001B8AA7F6|nr:enoyl-CoA hydratase/isomerase family protein [Leptolyngbya sp. 7M]QYO66228.1 enoyl-CoA hydratase/isomerase family protein [Leptolyngbya sp. 7M]